MNEIISIDRIFSEIESADFYTNIAVINNFDSFLIFLEEHPSIEKLRNLLSINLEDQDRVIERIKAFWMLNCDPAKLHPYDHCIAIYLYLIFETNKFKIEPLMQFVKENKLPNLYWTYHIYNFILRNRPSVITKYCDVSQIPTAEPLEFIDIEAKDTK
jgi:hypothetical protein